MSRAPGQRNRASMARTLRAVRDLAPRTTWRALAAAAGTDSETVRAHLVQLAELTGNDGQPLIQWHVEPLDGRSARIERLIVLPHANVAARCCAALRMTKGDGS